MAPHCCRALQGTFPCCGCFGVSTEGGGGGRGAGIGAPAPAHILTLQITTKEAMQIQPWEDITFDGDAKSITISWKEVLGMLHPHEMCTCSQFRSCQTDSTVSDFEPKTGVGSPVSVKRHVHISMGGLCGRVAKLSTQTFHKTSKPPAIHPVAIAHRSFQQGMPLGHCMVPAAFFAQALLRCICLTTPTPGHAPTASPGPGRKHHFPCRRAR